MNDPKVGHGPMMYCDDKGHCWPQMPCPNCGGSGMVGIPDNSAPFSINGNKIPEFWKHA